MYRFQGYQRNNYIKCLRRYKCFKGEASHHLSQIAAIFRWCKDKAFLTFLKYHSMGINAPKSLVYL